VGLRLNSSEQGQGRNVSVYVLSDHIVSDKTVKGGHSNQCPQ
jgi:hypothetical protein